MEDVQQQLGPELLRLRQAEQAARRAVGLQPVQRQRLEALAGIEVGVVRLEQRAGQLADPLPGIADGVAEHGLAEAVQVGLLADRRVSGRRIEAQPGIHLVGVLPARCPDVEHGRQPFAGQRQAIPHDQVVQRPGEDGQEEGQQQRRAMPDRAAQAMPQQQIDEQ